MGLRLMAMPLDKGSELEPNWLLAANYELHGRA